MPNTTAYAHASDVLPPKLLDRVMQALDGKPTKITFAAEGRRPNKSEAIIPSRLANKCREWVDFKESPRTLYFGGKYTENRIGKPAYAQFLSKRGVSTRAIQAALGITYPTAIKYGGKSSAEAFDVNSLPTETYSAYAEAGKARLQVLGVTRARTLAELQVHVGYALHLIETHAAKWDQRLEKAKKAL